jgi:hypothetical protein
MHVTEGLGEGMARALKPGSRAPGIAGVSTPTS